MMISSTAHSRLMAFSGSSGMCALHVTSIGRMPLVVHGRQRARCHKAESLLTPSIMEKKLNFRLSLELLKELDELRRAEPDLPSRGEMLRRLIQRAVAAAKAIKKKGV